LSQFRPLSKQASFFEAAGAVEKIDFRQSPASIAKFSLPKLVSNGAKNSYFLFSNLKLALTLSKIFIVTLLQSKYFL
jgi:hypothetical protein